MEGTGVTGTNMYLYIWVEAWWYISSIEESAFKVGGSRHNPSIALRPVKVTVRESPAAARDLPLRVNWPEWYLSQD
jgi:hypothetical protein